MENYDTRLSTIYSRFFRSWIGHVVYGLRLPSNLNWYPGALKLQKEKEKAKSERRKEKKEKKREKKEKAKQNSSDFPHYKKAKEYPTEPGHDTLAQKGEECWVDMTGKFNEKRRGDDVEQLERSGLTEEHELPVSSSKPCYSSDSTQNSNKRKRFRSPSGGVRSHGNILRIRLPLQKHKEPDASVSKDQICSTSGRTEQPRKHESENFCSTSVGTDPAQGFSFRNKEASCSTSGRTEVDKKYTRVVVASTSLDSELDRVHSLYKDLVANWTPPALERQLHEFDDQEWLFGRKHEEKQVEKRYKPTTGISCSTSSTLWPPRAQYLPEADIYALPYTLPF
ncbi:hypothetical protein RJ640_020825 [Escallonia rubra]|uniref:Uncharacterized protein n=1 Tax=Escallonia rubra TaxID=112253 RepID=A0AA88UH97_9ASTE|nr:hypothetical protein RJ640_020825 [Escallonia rubra]